MNKTIIPDILSAASDNDVKSIIQTAINSFGEDALANERRKSFIDDCLTSLASFNPMDKNVLQWNNIKLARVYFYRYNHPDTHT